MSVAGLKKQFHKATQRVSEKVGGAEGTKLDDDFTEMEKRVDTTARAVMDIITKTTEYLQPNPATRAKMSMMNSMSRIRGQEKGPGYTQTEVILGEAMQKFGRDLGDESNFGLALIDVGEAMRELGEVKDALDMEVKQNFIDPLQNLHEKDLREIQHHLKKLEGRRLDFDYKKKRQGKVTDDELKQALEKFDDSKEIAEQSMFHLLESDIEQVSQLAALVHAQVEYHTRAAEILTQLTSKIDERIKDTSTKPRKEFVPKPRTSMDFSINLSQNGGVHSARSPVSGLLSIFFPSFNLSPFFIFTANSQIKNNTNTDETDVQFLTADNPASDHNDSPMDQPCCRALYDFDPENEGELGFKEGDIITLTNKIDDNWYEGMLQGNSGFFPINYVDILVPLPH
ncbi:transforming acidic coiled-coil-containing protein 1 [Sarotherodon galilaeus]